MKPAPQPLDTRITLRTPEHVAFHHHAAGPAARAIAYAWDLAFRGIVLAVLALPITIVFGGVGLGEVGIGATLVLWFLLDWGWFTLFEALDGGRSLGKRIVGLRVVRTDGGPVGWSEALLRNLLRAADGLPVAYLLGVAAMATDSRFRRLGDRVAGTVVIAESNREWLRDPAKIEPPITEEERRSLPPRPRIAPALRQAVEEWLRVRTIRGPVWSEAVAERVAAPIGDLTQVHAPKLERQLQLVAAAARAEEADAVRLLASRQGEWKKLARLLDDFGIGGADARQAGQLLTAYRDACADLGRFRQTAVPHETLEGLEALCARAHDRVYASPRRPSMVPLRQLVDLLLYGFPAEVRAQRAWVAVSAALFVLPLVLGFVLSLTSPDFTTAVLPADMRHGMEEGYRAGVGRTGEQNTMMAGFYVFNNVGIALRSVAAGIFLGVGTVWVLVYNGLVIGTVAGFLTSLGIGGNLLRFTCGHSAWELTALVIAGAAGLRLGAALVLRNGHSVGWSLRAVGPSIGKLAAGSAAMLLVAASIEGFWSAEELPDAVKGIFAALNILTVTAWLTRAGTAR